MGLRGELFSSKVLLKNRSYFFNIKENRNGDLYFNIVESKNRDGAGFERQSVIVFEEDLQDFLRGFDEGLKVFEKSVRDKRREGGGRSGSREHGGRDEHGDRGGHADGEYGGRVGERSFDGEADRDRGDRGEGAGNKKKGFGFRSKYTDDTAD